MIGSEWILKQGLRRIERNRRYIASAVIASSVVVILAAFVAVSDALAEYEPAAEVFAGGIPLAIMPAPDRSTWLLTRHWSAAETDHRLRIMRVDRRKKRISQVKLPNTGPRYSRPVGAMAVGADGNVWVALGGVPRGKWTTIFKLTPRGKLLASYRLPRGRNVSSMATAPDGRIWFVGPGSDRVGRISRGGRISSFAVKGLRGPIQVLQGYDGDMWITAQRAAIRVSDRNLRRRYPATEDRVVYSPVGLARGPGKSMWLSSMNSLLRIAANGAISKVALQYPTTAGLPGANDETFSDRFVVSLATRPDGLIGFTAGAYFNARDGFEIVMPSVGVVSKDGLVRETTPDSYPFWLSRYDAIYPEPFSTDRRDGVGRLAAGQDGSMWLAHVAFVEAGVFLLPIDSTANLGPGVPSVAVRRRSEHSAVATITCAGSPGRFCSGTVYLRQRGKRVSGRRRYAVAVGDTLRIQLRSVKRLSRPRGRSSAVPPSDLFVFSGLPSGPIEMR